MGTLTGRSKNEAAFKRTALVSQLLGKDIKEEKGVWKLLRDSDVCLTKDEPEGENQEVLGCGGERYSLANKCYEYLLSLETFHFGGFGCASHGLLTSLLC